MRITKEAFTLVELIVVITILSIISTIAFVSLQGYGTDAGNSKRIIDLSNISNSILVKSENGIKTMTFVGGNNENKINVSRISVGGQTGTDDIYKAGILHYRVMGVKRDNFIDPNENDDYRIGATSTYGGRYELATVLHSNGGKSSFIKGNFSPRTKEVFLAEDTFNKVVTLGAKATNKFKRGDRLKTNLGTAVNIISVGRDRLSLTLDTDTTGITSLELAQKETEGLIASKDDDMVVVTHQSESVFPY